MQTREDPAAIKQYLLDSVKPLIPDLSAYEAFYLMVLPKFDVQREMFITKFDELFGGRLNGRCYTTKQTYHAKTVVPWEKELFISFGYENKLFGQERLDIPLPENCDWGAMVAIAYYVIGHIQSMFPPWFKEHADEYAAFQRRVFENKDA